jgi:hypothetical protein
MIAAGANLAVLVARGQLTTRRCGAESRFVGRPLTTKLEHASVVVRLFLPRLARCWGALLGV